MDVFQFLQSELDKRWKVAIDKWLQRNVHKVHVGYQSKSCSWKISFFEGFFFLENGLLDVVVAKEKEQRPVKSKLSGTLMGLNFMVENIVK